MLRYNMCLDTDVINSHHQIFIQVMCKVKVYLFGVYAYLCTVYTKEDDRPHFVHSLCRKVRE